MFEKFYGESDVRRSLRHLVDECHLSEHEGKDGESDGDAGEDNEAHPGDLSERLQLY